MMPYFFDVALSVQTELMMLILEIQSHVISVFHFTLVVSDRISYTRGKGNNMRIIPQ